MSKKRIVYVRLADNARVAFHPHGVVTAGMRLENVAPPLRRYFTAVEEDVADVEEVAPAAAPPPPEDVLITQEENTQEEGGTEDGLTADGDAVDAPPPAPPPSDEEDDGVLRVTLPIEGYSDLSQKAVLAELPMLDAHQLRVTRNFEKRNKNRPRILQRIAALLGEGEEG